jgi:excisionase family DNA binding protein
MAIDAPIANANVEPSREFLERQAFEAFKAFVLAFQRLVEAPSAALPATEESKEVMTADEVAEFLGVDRTTVYDFAARGVIPHQRLGKRLLFRRGGIVAWLDESLCRST